MAICEVVTLSVRLRPALLASHAAKFEGEVRQRSCGPLGCRGEGDLVQLAYCFA